MSWPWLVVTATVWLLIGVLGEEPPPTPLPAGPAVVEGDLLTGEITGPYGSWALLDTGQSRLLLDLGSPAGLVSGSTVRVEGTSDGVPGTLGSARYGSTLNVESVVTMDESPLIGAGTAVRDHVLRRLQPLAGSRALLAGFLIGDTSGLDPSDTEAMRLSGLSHFVAVSGSNIALFLGLLAVVAGPLAWTPRRRAVIGLLGLPVYAAATRFEPSVMRASMMAGLVLVGRLLGLLLEAWQLLALAVLILIVVDPDLIGSVGFQLSVAATAGVLVGGRWPVPRGLPARALAVTTGAQLALAPLLLGHFGQVPLLSPLVNLVAAPLVATATVTAAVGVAGLTPLTAVAEAVAGMVLGLARGASTWPQIGALPFAVTLGAVAVGMRWRVPRLVLVVVAAALVVVRVVGPGAGGLPNPGVVVLDVGQGDAILLNGGDGRYALVDGGPDPVTLVQKLREYGVVTLDLVVMTHVHADHLTGLLGVVGRYPVGEAWQAFDPHRTETSDELLSALRRWGVPVHEVGPGLTTVLGSLEVRVLGPVRRYKSPNDQSVVLEVRGPGATMLLTGDIELSAQSELAGLHTDVLKVPHQGGGTSDTEWLAAVDAELAVISVGENSFGHPVDWVIETLEGSGARVLRTDRDGDVVVDLSEPPSPPPTLRP